MLHFWAKISGRMHFVLVKLHFEMALIVVIEVFGLNIESFLF